MASAEEIKDIRLKKKEQLLKAGLETYPARTQRTHTVAALAAEVASKEDGDLAGTKVTIAGRLMSLRPQGALAFGNLNDGTGKFQFLLKKGEPLVENLFDLFIETVDIGDFIEVTGIVFTTNRGEKTVLVDSWAMLTKSLLPLPDKWHGLQDPDEKLRKRYLDILFDPEVRKMIELRSKFWDFIRTHLKKEGFIEVETPTLEVTTGGAEANPFKTHHADFDLDLYLRISVGELWQKRLLAAGLPRIFEIGRAYRNEGTSPDHSQEFTNMEFYAAFMDYREGMQFTENLIKGLVQEVFGTTQFKIRGFDVDFAGEWKQIKYVDTVEQMTGINILKASEEEIKEKLQTLKVDYEGKTRERLIDTLWKYCRKQIAGPVWLIDHPKLVSPLSKAHKDNPELTERAQLVLGGAEVANGFSELNDPEDQRRRFDEQQQLIDRGDAEAMMPDYEFVEMLEYGMPPAFGMGFGERLFGFLVDKPMREIQTFPLVKPKE